MKLKRKSLPIAPIYRKKTWRRFLRHAVKCSRCTISGWHSCEVGTPLLRAHVKRWGLPRTDWTITPLCPKCEHAMDRVEVGEKIVLYRCAGSSHKKKVDLPIKRVWDPPVKRVQVRKGKRLVRKA